MDLTINFIFLTILTLYVLLMGFILTGIYFDAEQRGANGWLVAGLVFFSGTILGTLAWLVFRPKMQPQPIPVRRS
ncbi:hypothetical protein ACFSKU_01805 [Pontibacter silvestris]|uniref:Cardiolipin synthase N-terminal domain-containing protein n=1 Tax=Pontibacter silvestris TaxID=2305183 RepID=A0ABW4WS71_9BACT|nr:hypothetical protein [Pontibacter silvestris]MCC9137859.1 hypothetical protein [Pontibacter silvestris]